MYVGEIVCDVFMVIYIGFFIRGECGWVLFCCLVILFREIYVVELVIVLIF